MRTRNRDLFTTVRTEGGLLPSDLLARVAAADPDLDGISPGDYHLAAGERLGEAISRSWNRLLGAWSAFDEARARLGGDDVGTTVTRERWLLILFQELGYGRLQPTSALEISGRRYPISHVWGSVPIHLVGCGVALDRRTPGVAGAATRSPHSMVQEFLNRSDRHLWAILSNGLSLRLLRDNVSLTRQAYVEFDLEAMMTAEAYSDFSLLWLLCHQSRVEGERPEDCWLERWSKLASEQGIRALDRLRDGVEEALVELGSGFLSHSANQGLRAALETGELRVDDYYRYLLRLVYRLLFLFVAEDRDLLHPPGADANARSRYERFYSTARLRTLAARRRGTRHSDLYESLKVVFGVLDRDGSEALALPPLGSFLFARDALGPLGDAQLENRRLLDAVRSLAFAEEDGVLRPVDYENLGAEEFGSVYESLLELHPDVRLADRSFSLGAVGGTERKTTGSYYTPSSLIRLLLDSALEPVLERAARSHDPERANHRLKVCDPAVGSGHFLIAAAHRMAARLAAVRSGEDEPPPAEYRRALRDVIGRCLYGVDANELAVELCKVSLWIEALEPGKPLSFLDHRILRGNSLLGATPEQIASGVPDDAFKAILGDEKEIASELRKRNKAERAGQLELEPADVLARETKALAAKLAEVEAIDDATPAELLDKARRYSELMASEDFEHACLVADAWCAAFVQPKRRDASAPPVTEAAFRRLVEGREIDSRTVEMVRGLSGEYGFFHWHLAFPDVFGSDGTGGFDVVLGNPPWERVKLQEKEFFASRAPEIASAANKAARERAIAELAESDPHLYREFQRAKRRSEGASHLLRDSGRFPLCGQGDVNTYSVFAELNRTLIGPTGRVGCIVPSGIATDDTTKVFFQDLVESGSLVSLYDFENRRRLFPAIDNRIKFCLLTLSGPGEPQGAAEFAFFLQGPEELAGPERRFELTAEDIALVNPNTKTTPIFRTRRDAELTKEIYRRVPVLWRDGEPDGNPWGLRFMRMFDMANDSRLFRTRAELEAEGWRLDGNVFRRGDDAYLPLYEGKMIHHFDHRWGTYGGPMSNDRRDTTEEEKRRADFVSLPRYWVPEPPVREALSDWPHPVIPVWRRNARSVDDRTLIATALPLAGVGDSLFLALPTVDDTRELLTFVAALSSMALDYFARVKIGGTNFSYFLLKQLPVIAPEQIRRPSPWTADVSVAAWIASRVEELLATTRDFPHLLGSVKDTRHHPWDPKRRELIRAELEAAFFQLYEFGRDDVEFALNSFEIVRRKDEDRFGEFRTKRLVLERYDALGESAARGTPYRTPLEHLPGQVE